MSRTNIRFKGIVRNANISDSAIGDCEELINVSSENGVLKIVKDKKPISVNIPYKDVTIHETGGQQNYIGKDSKGWVWFDPLTGLEKMRLYDSIDDVHVAFLNNMIVISDIVAIKQEVYIFKNGAYSKFYDGLDINIPYTLNSKGCSIQEKTYRVSGLSKEEFITGCQSVRNRILSENKDHCEGHFLVAFNYTLYDGSEVGLIGLKSIIQGSRYTRNGESVPEEEVLNAFISPQATSASDSAILAKFIPQKFYSRYTLTIAENEDLLRYKDLISKVNLYVSRPISRFAFDTEHLITQLITFGSDPIINWPANPSTATEDETPGVKFSSIPLDETKIESSLMFKMKSWTLEEISRGIEEYNLSFSFDEQTTNKTMSVSQPAIERAGKMFPFNNRMHIYDSRARLLAKLSAVSERLGTYQEVQGTVIVYLNNNSDSDLVMVYSSVPLYILESGTVSLVLPRMIVYPDSRAYKIRYVYGTYKYDITLASSPAYNYAYAFDDIADMEPFDEDIPEHNDTYEEDSSLNVTAQNNPIVFPVEHSYLFPGTIKALAYATEPVSQTQISQYPLYVFTDKGIYAMEQGINDPRLNTTGTVLYANQILINTDQCDDTVIQTRSGVVYISNGGIYILSGRNSLNISLPLSGNLDTDIRTAVAYPQCCMNNNLYNVENNLSQVKLEDYLPNASLVYIPFRDELIVSNPDYQYSYVFSFIYKSWHKITETITGVSRNVVQKAIFTSSSVAKAAEGRITIGSAVITPQHTFTCVRQAIYSGGDYQSNMNEKYALVVDGVQVSSAQIKYPTRLPLLIALLCKDIPYLDCWYDGTSHYILSSMEFKQGATVELVHTATGYTVFNIEFDTYESVVNIPAKGVGDSISVMNNIGVTVSTRQISSSDSVLSLTNELSEVINGNHLLGVHADTSINDISLTASTPGSSGNNIILTVGSGNYVSIYQEQLSGGKDITLEPGDYSVLIDYTREQDATKVIHIQTRPITFDQVFTIVQRCILYCRASITSEHNLSMYLFASDNLKDWQCVSASQKSDVIIEHIRLQRSARAHKYYIFIIGGKVFTTAELSHLAIELQERFNSKLR